jgi:hypothetical protein
MFGDQAPWLWLIMDVILVAALAAALIYGIGMWRRRYRDPGVQQVRDRATENLYRRPDAQ